MFVCIFALSGHPATRAKFVNIGLDDRGPDHPSCRSIETRSDLPEGSDLDSDAPQSGVYDAIADWYKNDEGYRIKVGYDVVWETMSVHRSGLTGLRAESLSPA